MDIDHNAYWKAADLIMETVEKNDIEPQIVVCSLLIVLAFIFTTSGASFEDFSEFLEENKENYRKVWDKDWVKKR